MRRRWTPEALESARRILGECRTVGEAARRIGVAPNALSDAWLKYLGRRPCQDLGGNRDAPPTRIQISDTVGVDAAGPDSFGGEDFPAIDVSAFDAPPAYLAGSGDAGIAESYIRVVVPDSHGAYIDPVAASVFLDDVAMLAPQELVFLGDHVDVSGIYSAHQPNYVEDREYSYETDIAAADALITAVQKRAPGATAWYLEGNHEAHVERWVSRVVSHAKDAAALLSLQAPDKRLHLKERGIQYVRRSECVHGLAVTGTIRLGKAYFTHGFTASKFATAQHVQRFGSNIIHGHTHRVQEYGTRTVSADAIGGWCPGTLALLQPLYQHTNPTEWRHGYGLQAVGADGKFVHVNVPIIGAWSGLRALLGAMRPKEWIK